MVIDEVGVNFSSKRWAGLFFSAFPWLGQVWNAGEELAIDDSIIAHVADQLLYVIGADAAHELVNDAIILTETGP